MPGIEYEIAETLVKKIQRLGALYSSMYHDAKNGRAMEVEVIVGTPTRKGRELGVRIPTIETLYALLLAIDMRMEKEREKNQ